MKGIGKCRRGESLAFAVGLCLAASALPSAAFVLGLSSAGSPKHWDLVTFPTDVHTNVVNPHTRAVRYFMASDGYSSGNTAAELNAIRASFAQWQAIPGTILRFEEGGLLAPRNTYDLADNTNMIFWAKSSTLVGNGDDISGALAVTFTSYFSDGTLVEADMALNGVEYGWFTDYSQRTNPDQFVEGTAIHEAGHFIGLSHSPLGGATMFPYGDSGVDAQVGLASDDIAGAYALYGLANQAGTRSAVKGTITRSGVGILGAMVVAEDTNGTMVAGTLSRANGSYEMPAMPPGNYQVRVSPLDPAGATDYLLQGADISSAFNSAVTSFLPTTNVPVTLSAGITNTLNFSVVNAEPPFRIAYMRDPTTNPGTYSLSGLPPTLFPGQSNLTIGVISPSLPTNNATLSISGDGLTIGSPVFRTNLFASGLNFISVHLDISSNATPGLRSFSVQQGANRAYANGFLDILPLQPDYNFDGLDDTFQRQYFPLFTAAAAAPNADPDGDGMSNASEYIAGTVPTNAASLLRITNVTETAQGTTVTWGGVVGKRYQLWSRLNLGTATWQTAGSPFPATNTTTRAFEATATNGFRFYRVQVLP
jgi:hypothetical protein